MCEYINEIPAYVWTTDTVTRVCQKSYMDSCLHKVHKPHHTNSIIKYAEYITGISLHLPEILHRLQRVTYNYICS